MTDVAELKSILVNTIASQMSMNVLQREKREVYEEELTKLLSCIEGTVMCIGEDVALAKNNQKFAESEMLRSAIVKFTKEHFRHRINLDGYTFQYEREGFMWFRGGTDSCNRDSDYDCVYPAFHRTDYSDKFVVIGINGKEIYRHELTCNSDGEHNDGLFRVTVDLEKDVSVGFTKCMWWRLSRDKQTFFDWIVAVHEFLYKRSTGRTAYDKEAMGRHFVIGIAEHLLDTCGYDSDEDRCYEEVPED